MRRLDQKHSKTFLLRSFALCSFLLLSAPLHADWLVTEKGQMIETLGAWTIEAELLSYKDLDGHAHTVDLKTIDLAGSEETTALRAGRPYVPKAVPTVQATSEAETTTTADVKQEPIVLYMTSWCGYCRKAKKLLTDLDANFVEKNIEKDREAALEFQKKVGRGSGIPVIDFEGTIVRGYNAKMIKQLAAKHKAAAPKS